MKEKTFNIISLAAMVFSLAVAMLSVIAAVVIGAYPGIIILIFIPLIPIGIRYFSKRKLLGGQDSKTSYLLLSFFDVLIILIVLWMSFVIIHDRILNDCC